MTRPVGVGIVGMGWGANHARVLSRLAPLVEVRALCSRRPARAEALAMETGLPRSVVQTSWEELVQRADIDLVVVTTPDYLHYPITMAAIAGSKHVFCEKPLAMTQAQAQEMLEAAETAKVSHFTGMNWRYALPVATIKQALRDGRVGEVRMIDSHFRVGPPVSGREWKIDPEQRAGGALGNLGIHLIDMTRYLARAEGPLPEPDEPGNDWRIWARCDSADEHERTRSIDGSNADVAYAALSLEMKTPYGVVHSRMQVSQLHFMRTNYPVCVEVHGTLGSAAGYANPLSPGTQRAEFLPRISAEPEPLTPLIRPGGLTETIPSHGRVGMLRPAIKHVYQAYVIPEITGEAPIDSEAPTFRDGYIAQRVMEAALSSARSGRWVTV